MSVGVSMNPANKKLMDDYKKSIYEAAVIYKNFIQSDRDKIEKDKVIMISKDYTDKFKEKINYDKIGDLLIENTEYNFEKFDEQLKNYSLTDLEEIIFSEINIFGELDELEDNVAKGFDFVNFEFLEKLDFEFPENNRDNYEVKYIKDLKNIIIIFNDESKLLIIPHGKEIKYHAIPGPIKSSKKINLRRANTILIKNRKKDKTVVVSNSKKQF
jgi:hypothetical protein